MALGPDFQLTPHFLRCRLPLDQPEGLRISPKHSESLKIFFYKQFTVLIAQD